ncbi:hypothetical protein Poli38472_012625 [Pythium oligandrum]|uniref:Auxiliary Activity family 9 catalytic domain-containing protein n=1 Tax=Pythium oligandrum TaxID=41045 RepID=A0A8K1CDI7_PYTOL|nr:hypothetical protein Poli38472_012625 [Pythium oligandrum]|eukprot:TMW61434.1 hypothetical protein Poli38472_012625 [Pythium oligandrum]
MKSAAYLSALASALLATEVLGHGFMTIPAGRSGDVYSDMTDSGACDAPAGGKVTEYKAGQEIDVEWSRNNHLGGFIRYSMVPKGQDNKANFDKNAFFYTCRETNCSLKQCKDKWCGDDAGSKDHQIKCRTKIKLPDYLPAGDYVLQWTWHAAGSSYGNVGWNTGNYKTCADIRLTTSGSGSKPKCPTFVGGDRVTKMENKPSDQCFYFDQNGLDKKEVKVGSGYGEDGKKLYKYGKPKEIEQCGGGASAPAPAPKPAPGPAPKPGPAPAPKPAPAPAPAPGNGGSGGFKYCGPSRPDAAALTTWCNQNCPGFCPGDMCCK